MDIIRQYKAYNEEQYKHTNDEFYSLKNMVDRLYQKCSIKFGDHDTIHDIDELKDTMFSNIISCIGDFQNDSDIEKLDYQCSICGSSFRSTINTNTLQFNIYQLVQRYGCDSSLYKGYSKTVDVYNNSLYVSSVRFGRPKLASMRGRKEIGESRDKKYENAVYFLTPYLMEINIHKKDNNVWFSNDPYIDKHYMCNLPDVNEFMISSDSNTYDGPINHQRRITLKNGRYKITNNLENLADSSHNQVTLTIEPLYYF